MNIKAEIQTTAKEMLMTDTKRFTIQALCQQLNISRKTFYKYYQDKYDLIHSMIHDDLFITLSELSQLENLTTDDSITLLYSFYSKIYDNRDFYTRLNQISGDEGLFVKFIYEENVKLNQILFDSMTMDDVEREYHIHFAASAGASLIEKWIRDGFILSPRQISKIFDTYITRAWDKLLNRW